MKGFLNRGYEAINQLLDKLAKMPEEGVPGKTPVIQTGETATLEAGSAATAQMVQDGTDEAGNPIYKVNFGIPRGYNGEDVSPDTYYTKTEIDGRFSIVKEVSEITI